MMSDAVLSYVIWPKLASIGSHGFVNSNMRPSMAIAPRITVSPTSNGRYAESNAGFVAEDEVHRIAQLRVRGKPSQGRCVRRSEGG